MFSVAFGYMCFVCVIDYVIEMYGCVVCYLFRCYASVV